MRRAGAGGNGTNYHPVALTGVNPATSETGSRLSASGVRLATPGVSTAVAACVAASGSQHAAAALGELDEDVARRAVLVQADVDVALVVADAELAADFLAVVG